MSRHRTYSDVTQTTFDTPLVRLGRLFAGEQATVLLKLEFFNPFSSVKDRIGRAMIEAAEKDGYSRLRPKSSSRPAAIRALRWRSWQPRRAIA